MADSALTTWWDRVASPMFAHIDYAAHGGSAHLVRLWRDRWLDAVCPPGACKDLRVTEYGIGAALLWLGWVGFNGGSALAVGPLASASVFSSHIAACTAALVWATASYFSTVSNRKTSLIETANGAIAGLAGITPAAGFVPMSFAAPIGALVGVASYCTCRLVRDKVRHAEQLFCM